MSNHDTATVFPCPFSKGYGIPARQAWTLLRVYLTYRFILACLFMVLLYGPVDASVLTLSHTTLFFFSSQGYLLLTILSALLVSARLTGYASHAQFLIFTDIVFLSLLMHACGGVRSGIGILLAVAIAAGGLLVGGRCSMLFAALASLAVLIEQLGTTETGGLDISGYPHAGMLGAAFFTIALLAHFFATQSEQALRVSNQQQETIVKLEDLNAYIIQHLQSGIIITDPSQSVQLANDAAIQLTYASARHPSSLAEIAQPLADAFADWLADNSKDFAQIRITEREQFRCRFMSLPNQHDRLYLIIIEDSRLYKQRLQQSKLASLGRLAASIAHEIRNPLGAISHAGQLLSESPALSAQEQHLTEIICNQCLRVNHIIEDILLLSKRSDSRREHIELNAWLSDYLRDFLEQRRILPDAFQLSLPQDPLLASVDPEHLRQILDNLCQNALRYGKPELGPILIRCGIFDRLPGLEVIDNGGGINEDTAKHLFEPFFTTSRTGTGLGLYISKELAELNQAKLVYYLTDEHRSCFQLRLLDATENLIEI